MPKKSSPFQAHKHHSKCQAGYLLLLGQSGVEFGRIGHFEGLGAVLGLTPERLLPAVLHGPAGPHADLPRALNTVHPDHLRR